MFIPPKPELGRNVDVLSKATTLAKSTGRFAGQLWGEPTGVRSRYDGFVLSTCVHEEYEISLCLKGNTTNSLAGEYSTGIDAKMRRDMWSVSRNVAAGKAVATATRE